MSAALLRRHWVIATFLMVVFYGVCQVAGYAWGMMVPGESVGWLVERSFEIYANAVGDDTSSPNKEGAIVVLDVSVFRFVPQEWMVYASRFIFDGLWPVIAAVWLFCCLRGTTAEGMTALLQFFSRAYYYIAMCFFAASFMLLDFDAFFADEDVAPALAVLLFCWGVAVALLWFSGIKTFFDVWSDAVFLQVGNFFSRKKRE